MGAILKSMHSEKLVHSSKHSTCKIFNLNFPVSTVRKKIISTKKSSALHQYLVLFIGLFSYEIASSVGYRKPSEQKEILLLNVEKIFFD